MSSLRFYPERKDISYFEHVYRYLWASLLVKNLKVLDVSSGEGYGSEMRSYHAREFVGADLDSEVVKKASLKYASPNLRYIAADGTALPFPIGEFQAVVSFETIEHLSEPEVFVSELRRVLCQSNTQDGGGLLIISTPNTIEYSVKPKYHNPDHLHEFTLYEFRKLLEKYFKHVQIYGQTFWGDSHIAHLSNMIPDCYQVLSDRSEEEIYPMYFVAICLDVERPKVPAKMFGNPDANDEFSKAKKSITALEDEIKIARNVIHDKEFEISEVSGLIEAKDFEIEHARADIETQKQEIKRAQDLLVKFSHDLEKSCRLSPLKTLNCLKRLRL